MTESRKHDEMALIAAARAQLDGKPVCIDRIVDAERIADFKTAVSILVYDSTYWPEDIFE